MSRTLNRMWEEAQAQGLVPFVDLLLRAHPFMTDLVMWELAAADPYTRLRFELKSHRISNKEIARRLGIHESAIARGFSTRSGLDKHWDRLAELLNVDPLWLKEGKGEEVRKVRSVVPVVGTLNAGQNVEFFPTPRHLFYNIDATVQVSVDVPSLGLTKGSHLLLVSTAAKPGALAVIRLKNGRARIGRVLQPIREKGDHDQPDIILDDGSGRAACVHEADVAEQYLVDGVLYGHQLLAEDNEPLADKGAGQVSGNLGRVTGRRQKTERQKPPMGSL